MTNIDSLISNININGRTPNKEELWNFIKESLVLIGDINDFYKKLHEGSEEEESIIKSVEDSFNKIKENYDILFTPDSNGITKSLELQNKIKEIEEYHIELTDGDESIKSNIEESQKHINEFYDFLFDETNNREENTKQFIKEIEEYHTKLTEGDNSIESSIDKIYKSFTDKYSELFGSEGEENSKIEELEVQIKSIDEFHDKINNEIKTDIEEKQQSLSDLNTDINVKRKELNALLSDATAKTLAEGYIESMHVYSSSKKIKIKSWKWNILNNIYISFYNVIFRFSTTIFSYAVFLLPLLLMVYLFSQPDLIKSLIDNLTSVSEGLKPSIPSIGELIFFKGLIGLPLLWISWFGQKTISQRKRLFEEYNHKYRVVQMYLMFITNEKNYTLEQTKELEDALLEVIKNNPAVHLGKGETIIDKVFEKIKVEGVYKKLKEEIKTDLKDLNN